MQEMGWERFFLWANPNPVIKCSTVIYSHIFFKLKKEMNGTG